VEILFDPTRSAPDWAGRGGPTERMYVRVYGWMSRRGHEPVLCQYTSLASQVTGSLPGACTPVRGRGHLSVPDLHGPGQSQSDTTRASRHTGTRRADLQQRAPVVEFKRATSGV